VPFGKTMQYLEQYQFWDKSPRSKPHEDFPVGLQRLARFGIVCVMPRHMSAHCGQTNQSRSFFLLIATTIHVICIAAPCGHGTTGNEARIALRVVNLDRRRVERHNRKHPMQSRVAAVTKHHGQSAVLERSGAADKIAKWHAFSRYYLPSPEISGDRSTLTEP
jgi:hypothetical protein